MLSIERARTFVHTNGQLWERALFAHLFEGQPAEHLHRCLLAYKNEDNGFGHGLEPDIKTPDSNPLQLDFLLTVIRETGIDVGPLLDGTPEWVEAQVLADGRLANPESVHRYPHAPWWGEGGQDVPAAIVGNLRRLGRSTPKLEAAAQKWAEQHLTLEKIEGNEWLFMAYHAHDYYLTLPETPQTKPLQEATVRNIVALAEKAPAKSLFTLFHFAATPDTPVAKRLPPQLLSSCLDHLAGTQREDGGWEDEHGLAHWQPYMSTLILWALRNHGRV